MNLTRKLFTREAFMGFFILSVGGVLGLIVGIPIIGVVLSPLIQQPTNVWRDVGPTTLWKFDGDTIQRNFAYPVTQPSSWAGPTQLTAAWVRRVAPNQFVAYAVYCTHLGCPVHWLPDPKIFLCPCHGSVFNGDGTVAGGPAPRPLFQYQTRVRNGRVEVKTEAQPLAT